MSDIIIQKVLKNATADNIESTLELFCILVEKLKEVKRKFDLEYNSKPTLKSKDFNETSKYPRACKTRKKYNKKDSDEEEDDDSSSDYIPYTDSDDDEDDEEDDEE
jgi:hypothetical protein